MLRLRAILHAGGLLALAACLNGCDPGDARVEEKKDPHYERGVTLAEGLDYKGAADEFEKSLELNPRSAAAHFELACLYDTKLSNGAAAIYHYQRHLELMTNSPHAGVILQRIQGCKQELATAEFLPPNTQNLQHKMDDLLAENLALKKELAEALRRPAIVVAPAETTQTRTGPMRLTQTIQNVRTISSARPRVHVVHARETISSIATQYGIKASAILAANPRVNARRLKVGQSLALPQ